VAVEETRTLDHDWGAVAFWRKSDKDSGAVRVVGQGFDVSRRWGRILFCSLHAALVMPVRCGGKSVSDRAARPSTTDTGSDRATNSGR
jgi:hypothetical protein